MSIIELNVNIEDMDEFEPLPAGMYRAQVREVEIKFSEKQPTGYYVIQLMIHPDNYPADYDTANQPDGALITYARTAVPTPENRRSVKPFKALLRALGIPVQGNTFDEQEWIGKELNVLLKVDEYQGTPTNQVESVMAVTES